MDRSQRNDTRKRTPTKLCGALLAVVALALTLPARAQTPATASDSPTPYFWRTIDTDHGLPETQVLAVTQAADGFFWLGTRRGLVRYDGLNFKPYPPESRPELGSGVINSLASDKERRLWISTERGLTVLEEGKFRQIPPSIVPDTMTWEVLQDRRGRIWVAGAYGVLVGDGKNFRRVPGASSYAYALFEDKTGRIWMAGRSFLASIGVGESTATSSPIADGERFFAIVSDGADGIWVGTRNGAWHLDTRDFGAVRGLERIGAAAPDVGNEVWTLARTADGILWLGTEMQGVLQWDGARLTKFAGANPLSGEQVWSLFADARGRMWAGTSAGMTRFERSPFTTYANGLQPTSVWGVRADANGTLWASTSDGVIARFADDQWTPVVRRAGRNLSSSLALTASGTMLAVHTEKQLLRLDASGAHSEKSIKLPPSRVNGFYPDRDGSIWFLTDSGVFHSHGAETDYAQASLGLAATDRPNTILRDRHDRLVIGAPGLTVMKNGAVTHYGRQDGLSDLQVSAILDDDHDNIWIGTADSGLYVLRHERIAHLGDVDPRLKREIGGLVIDRLGNLWLTSRFGLTRVARTQLEQVADGRSRVANVRHFDRSDGLPTTEFNSDFVSTIIRDDAGYLWLPSFAGVVRVDPAQVSADTLPPQIHLDRLVVDGNEVPLGATLALERHPARVELTFAATNALVPSRVRVEYRLIGVDDAWRDAEGKRTAAFGPLRGGHYRFEVRAASEDGSWNPTVASLEMTVDKTVPEQVWFYPVLLGVAALAISLVVRWRQHRLVQRGKELEAQVDARTRDLEESHATLEARVRDRTVALERELEERRRLEQRLLTSQKMESIGRLAGGVAHEINNSMTAVLGFAELAQVHAKGQGALEDDLRDLVRAGRRVAEITRQLLAFARRQQSQPVPLQLEELVIALERTLQHVSSPHVRLTIDTDAGLPPVLADAAQVEQLLLNLVKNARDAMPTGGTTSVRLQQISLAEQRAVGDAELAAGEYVTLAVSDTGVGIDEEVRRRLFEPFFTTKELNKGTGLGLAVCHGIVATHHGAIEVSSRVGFGTTFTVWLPVYHGRVERAPATDVLSTGRETILLAEDEPTVRALTMRMLELQGYRVLAAEDGLKAFALAESVDFDFDLILSDVKMPGMTGPELVEALRARRPELPVVFISGYTGPDAAQEDTLSHLGAFLTKPFTREALTRAVREALDGRAAVGTANA